MKDRIIWIDWAKTLGIWSAVLGHFTIVYPDINGFLHIVSTCHFSF